MEIVLTKKPRLLMSMATIQKNHKALYTLSPLCNKQNKKAYLQNGPTWLRFKKHPTPIACLWSSYTYYTKLWMFEVLPLYIYVCV